MEYLGSHPISFFHIYRVILYLQWLEYPFPIEKCGINSPFVGRVSVYNAVIKFCKYSILGELLQNKSVLNLTEADNCRKKTIPLLYQSYSTGNIIALSGELFPCPELFPVWCERFFDRYFISYSICIGPAPPMGVPLKWIKKVLQIPEHHKQQKYLLSHSCKFCNLSVLIV